MTVQEIGPDRLLICLGRQDLEGEGADAELSGAEALRILNDALFRNGEQPWERAELELIQGREGAMLFAVCRDLRPEFYAFRGLEKLLCAVSALPELRSDLHLLGEEYILTLWLGRGAGLSSAPAEFGERLVRREDFVRHLHEHGKELLHSDAAAKLKFYF